MNEAIEVEGMGCDNCVRHVTEALEGLPGVKDVKVDLTSGQVNFENSESVTMDEISAAIEEAGYKVVK